MFYVDNLFYFINSPEPRDIRLTVELYETPLRNQQTLETDLQLIKYHNSQILC